MASTALKYLPALIAEQRPGRCVLCDDPVGKHRRRLCGDSDCRRVWMRLYFSAYYLDTQKPKRVVRRAARAAARRGE